eukprot:5950943-Prymnesium_polylepis.1
MLPSAAARHLSRRSRPTRGVPRLTACRHRPTRPRASCRILVPAAATTTTSSLAAHPARL